MPLHLHSSLGNKARACPKKKKRQQESKQARKTERRQRNKKKKEKLQVYQKRITRQGKEEKYKLPGLRKKVKEKNKTITEMKDPMKEQNAMKIKLEAWKVHFGKMNAVTWRITVNFKMRRNNSYGTNTEESQHMNI